MQILDTEEESGLQEGIEVAEEEPMSSNTAEEEQVLTSQVVFLCFMYLLRCSNYGGKQFGSMSVYAARLQTIEKPSFHLAVNVVTVSK